MKVYENPILEVVVWWQEDVLTGSGEFEKFSSLSDWFGFSGFSDNLGGGE